MKNLRFPGKFSLRPPGMRQTSMPSQNPGPWQQDKPFNPVNQPDIRRPYPTTLSPDMIAGEQDTIAAGGAPAEFCIVQHVFDSRPRFAYDWYFQDKIQDIGTLTVEPAPTILQGYRVPDGYNLFLRRLRVSIYTDADVTNLDGDNDFPITEVPLLAVIVDGVSTPYWTDITRNVAGAVVSGVPLFDVYFRDVEIPMFVLVPGGSTVTAQIILNFPFINGQTFNVYFEYYGNMVQSTGRELTAEVGNGEPIPVQTMSEMG